MIISVIKSLDYKDKTAEQIYSILNDKNIDYTDTNFWTWAGVADVIGNQGAECLRIALSEGGMGWAIHQLGGKGLILSRQDIQQVLYSLHNHGIPGMELLASAVKRKRSILEDKGIVVTLAEVKEALNYINLQDYRDLKIDQAQDRLYNYKLNMNTWDGNPDTEPKL
jgi:hypothetical protein